MYPNNERRQRCILKIERTLIHDIKQFLNMILDKKKARCRMMYKGCHFVMKQRYSIYTGIFIFSFVCICITRLSKDKKQTGFVGTFSALTFNFVFIFELCNTIKIIYKDSGANQIYDKRLVSKNMLKTLKIRHNFKKINNSIKT